MAGFWANYLRSNPLRLAVKRWAPSLFKVSREIKVSLGAAEIDYHGMKPANIDDLARKAAMC